MVLRGLKVEGILHFFRILAILSIIPWMKGRYTLELRSMGSFLTFGTFVCFEEGFDTMLPTIDILDRNIKEMGLFFRKVVFIRISQSTSG